jgi:hypothetical protein
MVFCDDREIHAVREVNEEAGTVKRLRPQPEGEYALPDGVGSAYETLSGKVKIMLKPNASEEARTWFEKMRQAER